MVEIGTSFEAGITLAHRLFSQGRRSDAVNALDALANLALTPDLQRRLAIHFNELNMPQKAIVLLLSAVRHKQDDADLLNSLALTYWSLGQYGKAEYASRQALKRAPLNPLFHANLALALLHQGRYPEAWPHFRQRHMVIPYRRDWASEHRTWRGELLGSDSLLLFCS